MQLVAYGAQDVYLTGNPQITFFKVVYRRHTNFSMESIEQTFNGNADFGKKVTCTISRNGDLIFRTYLQVTIPDVTVPDGKKFRWVNWLGHQLINNVVLEIGGQQIDKHYGQWLHIWNELSQTTGHKDGYANMVGNVPQLTQFSNSVKGTTLYIPLEFWFNRNPGLALPLIALQYHEVKINLEFNPASSMYKTDATGFSLPSLGSASLFIDYIYLDTDERRRFAQVSHEYLIEQLQYTGSESTTNTNNKIKLNFNHPCKEIIWTVQPDKNIGSDVFGGPQWFNYTDAIDLTYNTGTPSDPNGGGMGLLADNQFNQANLPLFDSSGTVTGATGGSIGAAMVGLTSIPLFDVGRNCISTAKLQLNGHDRFVERDGRYFNLVQPYQHHTNVPETGVNVYSFALKPEEHQPSGTCNFSRIDNATLLLTLTPATIAQGSAKINVYATNYNVLRIMSGMGGLAYSN